MKENFIRLKEAPYFSNDKTSEQIIQFKSRQIAIENIFSDLSGATNKLFLSSHTLEFFLRKRVQELCRGTFNRPAKLEKNLHCHWLHQNNPFLKVGPFKFELKHKHPDIGYIHDMASKAEVEGIKKG
jgi:hypothetical protein